jgi:hypothetical protein
MTTNAILLAHPIVNTTFMFTDSSVKMGDGITGTWWK